MISIYKITHKETGKCYIGQAQDVEKRWKNHCSQSSGCKKLKNAIKKYGKDAFDFKVLFECDPEHADALETQCICWYGSVKNGYNICPQGGSTRGRKHSAETKKKMSSARKGKRTGEKSPASKLTDLQREEIRNLYKTGEYSQAELGKIFNISQMQISRIIRG